MSFVKRLQHELIFKVSRSGGPGGQNVNKVNSKVTISFDVGRSNELSPEEKEIILQKLASKLTTDGVLVLSAQDSRSQLENKQAAMAKLDRLITKAFENPKPRKATKPSKSSIQKRMKRKKQLSEKKKWRQKL